MSDKKLLELAAKAVGINLTEAEWHGDGFYWMPLGTRFWNPLTNDADAFQLMVKIGLRDYCSVEVMTECAQVTCMEPYEHTEFERHEGDPYAATRRAIVRAAAEIGRQMK